MTYRAIPSSASLEVTPPHSSVTV